MELCSTAVSCMAAFLLLHLGLISSMAQQNEVQTGLVGGEVTLKCTGIPLDSKLSRDEVSWMYYKTLLWRTENNNAWRTSAFPTHRADVKMENKQLRMWDLKLSDAGIYTCKSSSHEVRISLHIFKCFQNPDLERKYATVDSTVILSWHLNSQKIKWKEGFTGQLNWKQQEGANAHELLDFKVTAQGELHETKKSSNFLFEIPERNAEIIIEVKLPKVYFNHSGQYQCQLEYQGRHVQSKIELVVMKVSANPDGPLSRGANMTLTCQVSGPLPPNAYLRWERVNGTNMDVKNSRQHEIKLEVNISAAGLWSCHLIEDNDRKISLHYHVEEAPVWISYVIIGASVAGSLLVFALGCLCIISGISWQRRMQRRKRMAQARQYLLENKTCQCQHRLN
ncbi:T-cell surface glycoprotein CD4 isoform X2 [Corvus moneduloides]|uniref:T-cell surface glycoprotein CD4 isoform X2 n=1 Tax=Corvus moneduloides TaxID=1196302 RepID=UPI0013644D9E|nr:T-cell surface glycoprotein CD4 isoform X2 [Corvus moneduloides]